MDFFYGKLDRKRKNTTSFSRYNEIIEGDWWLYNHLLNGANRKGRKRQNKQNKQQGKNGRAKEIGKHVQIRWVFEDLIENSQVEPA